MQVTISHEAEAEFLDNLILDLFTEDETLASKKDVNSNRYKIDKEVVNYIFDKNENNDTEVSDILQNLYSFLEQNKKNSTFYSALQNNDLKTFLSSSIIERIENAIVFHLIRQKIVGKEDSVEYKLAFRKLADTYSNEIADYEEEKFYLAQQISSCIVQRNPKQTLENINLLNPEFKKATYIRKNNKLVQTNLFHKQEFYKILDDILIQVSFINGKKLLTEYELKSNKISEIELDKLEEIGYFKNVNYTNYKAFDKAKLISKLKTKLFNFYVKDYKGYIKIPNKKYQENEYRDKIMIVIFKILKSEFNFASTHVLSIVTGFISAELGLINSEHEHFISTYKYSYNQYLNKTVKNILAKHNLI